MTVRDSTSGRANRLMTAGVIWLCAAQFFLAQVIAQSRWTTPFSLATNYISDLGNTTCGLYPLVTGSYVCSPWHTVMNISFVLQGVIILVGAVLARPALAGLRWRAVIFQLLVVTALGIVGVGLFPEDVNNRAHVISAGTQFITGNAAMILFGIAASRVKQWRVFAVVSSALGITGLLATALFPNGYGLGIGVGGMERVAAYTLPIWLITAGVLIVRKSALIYIALAALLVCSFVTSSQSDYNPLSFQIFTIDDVGHLAVSAELLQDSYVGDKLSPLKVSVSFPIDAGSLPSLLIEFRKLFSSK